jgi:Lrp/AsnC family transcriptional regulator, regulator for asnA, asnC and gidA
MEKKTIDNLDRKILNFLIENSRKAYAEIANELNVSPATIFVRVEKMREALN